MVDQNRDEEVRARAYEIWEHEGRPGGDDYSHWYRALQELGLRNPTDQPMGSTVDPDTATNEAEPALTTGLP
jgi:hypothetical protein